MVTWAGLGRVWLVGCCLQVAGVWDGLCHMGGCWLGDGNGRGLCFSSSSKLALLVKCHSHRAAVRAGTQKTFGGSRILHAVGQSPRASPGPRAANPYLLMGRAANSLVILAVCQAGDDFSFLTLHSRLGLPLYFIVCKVVSQTVHFYFQTAL